MRRRKIANGASVGLDLPNLFEVANQRQAQRSRPLFATAWFRNFVKKKIRAVAFLHLIARSHSLIALCGGVVAGWSVEPIVVIQEIQVVQIIAGLIPRSLLRKELFPDS